MPKNRPPKPNSPRTQIALRPPGYRSRRGYEQALVTLTDSRTKKRRDYWLGPFGSPQSRELYHLLIAQWEALDRRLPDQLYAQQRIAMQIRSTRGAHGGESRLEADETISDLIGAYWRWTKTYYSSSERTLIKGALRIVRKLFGSTPASEFGPNRLRLVRDDMVRGDPHGDKPRIAWSRPYVNGQIHRVCAMFKWAASHEKLPASIYQQLKTVPALKRGRSPARETKPVGPVAVETVEATRPFLSRQVNALIDLQLNTGARGGELFMLRPRDLVMEDSKGVWMVYLKQHKTAHHGHARTLYLGPKAQAAIRPFLSGAALDACLFSPAQAEQERLAARAAARKTPLSCGNVPGSNRVQSRRWTPADHYTADSYRRAIERACDQAFPHPDPVYHRQRIIVPGARSDRKPRTRLETLKEVHERLTVEQREELNRWRKAHRWHPHQLRHTAATIIRRECGLEAARIALGHSSALVTDAVYAQRDMDKVVEVMKRIG